MGKKKTASENEKPRKAGRTKSAKSQSAAEVEVALAEPATPALKLGKPKAPKPEPAPEAQTASSEPAKSAAPAKKATKPKAAKTRKASTSKSGKATAKSPSSPRRPTTEEIALRAYYIAERRQRMGWPGDSQSDWLEAERQLLEEAKEEI